MCCIWVAKEKQEKKHKRPNGYREKEGWGAVVKKGLKSLLYF